MEENQDTGGVELEDNFPSNTIYDRLGWSTINSIRSTPYIVPAKSHPNALLGIRIDFSSDNSEMQVLSGTYPFEVLVGLIWNLAETAHDRLQIFAKGPYQIDTQLMSRSSVENLLDNTINHLSELRKLIETTIVDDSAEQNNEDANQKPID